MKKSEVTNVSRMLNDLLENIMRLSNKLTLMQAELDMRELEDELLSENLSDFLDELAGLEVSLDELDVDFIQNLQHHLISALVDEDESDDGVYRD
jgi:predicted nuclease with TOPRIM domain